MGRKFLIDILKLVLSIMIVGIHTDFLGDLSNLGAYLTQNGIFRIAIPLFLLINGFYFYSAVITNKTSCWFKHIISLYVFWTVFYAYFWLIPHRGSSVEIGEIAQTILIGYYHLWYLPGLIGAAFLLSILHKYQVNMLYLVVLLFIAGVSIQYSGNYQLIENQVGNQITNYDWIHRNFLFLSFPFFALGFLFNKHNTPLKVRRILLLIVATTGLLLLLCESYLNYTYQALNGGFDNLASLILVCPSLFLLFMQIDIEISKFNISKYSNGIYFIHPFLISLSLKFTNIESTPLTVLVVILSILFTFVLIRLNRNLKFIL